MTLLRGHFAMMLLCSDEGVRERVAPSEIEHALSSLTTRPRGVHERPGLHRRREAGEPLVVPGQLPGTGEQVTITTDAFEARAFQHEMDHCQGFLFLDRVAGAHAIHPRQTYL